MDTPAPRLGTDVLALLLVVYAGGVLSLTAISLVDGSPGGDVDGDRPASGAVRRRAHNEFSFVVVRRRGCHSPGVAAHRTQSGNHLVYDANAGIEMNTSPQVAGCVRGHARIGRAPCGPRAFASYSIARRAADRLANRLIRSGVASLL